MEKKLEEKTEDIIYFCPDTNCRTIFKDIYNDHKIIDQDEKYQYQCKYCKEHFNLEDYGNIRNHNKQYKIPKECEEGYVENLIGDLWDKGYSNEKIQKITHFSKAYVGKFTKEFNSEVAFKGTREEFIKEFLFNENGFFHTYISNIEPYVSSLDFIEKDITRHKVKILHRMGAGIPQIEKILKMRTKTISKYINTDYEANRLIKNIVTNEENIHSLSQMSKTNISIDDRKNIDRNKTKLKPLLELFLEKVEPHKSSSSKHSRSRVLANKETGMVRVFARKLNG